MVRVAIIGRQNVGKSTLYNALFKERKNIEYDFKGTTRDIIESPLSPKLSLADFPGFENIDLLNDPLQKQAVLVALDKIKSYSLILWVVAHPHITSYELELRKILHDHLHKVWLIVNFVDDSNQECEAFEFYKLGIEPLFFISASNSRNIKDLRENIFQNFKLPLPQMFTPRLIKKRSQNKNNESMQVNNQQAKCQPTREIPAGDIPTKVPTEYLHANDVSLSAVHTSDMQYIKLAIIGKPNVGKSTFFNKLIQKDIALISDIPGTTRDILTYKTTYHNMPIEIVDTAGMRKDAKIHDDIEFFSVRRTKKAMEQADVALLMISIDDWINVQYKIILQVLQNINKPCILIINKTDIIKDQPKYQDMIQTYEKHIEEFYKPYWHFPYLFISSLNDHIPIKILKKAEKLTKVNQKKINTKDLNNFIQRLNTHPLLINLLKLKYITQFKPNLSFLIYTNKKKIATNIQTWVKNQIRHHFHLETVPIQVKFRYSNK